VLPLQASSRKMLAAQQGPDQAEQAPAEAQPEAGQERSKRKRKLNPKYDG
jgi:hypothetical protein